MLIIPAKKFNMTDIYLIWKMDKINKNNSVADKYYSDKIGILKKNFYKNKNIITFFTNTSKIISQHSIIPKVISSSGTGQDGIVLYYKDSDNISFLHKHKGLVWRHKTY